LRIVTDRAASRNLLYLAHLILGGIAEQEGHPDLAYEEYETAHTMQPEAQSAHIALMRSARMTGRVDRAQRLFDEYASRTSASEDPWWYFSMGLDPELAAWLHAQVTEP
jgi:Tfp pilus assembly protein PilF